MIFIATLLVCLSILVIWGCYFIFKQQSNLDMLISDKNNTTKTPRPSAPRYDYSMEF